MGNSQGHRGPRLLPCPNSGTTNCSSLLRLKVEKQDSETFPPQPEGARVHLRPYKNLGRPVRRGGQGRWGHPRPAERRPLIHPHGDTQRAVGRGRAARGLTAVQPAARAQSCPQRLHSPLPTSHRTPPPPCLSFPVCSRGAVTALALGVRIRQASHTECWGRFPVHRSCLINGALLALLLLLTTDGAQRTKCARTVGDTCGRAARTRTRTAGQAFKLQTEGGRDLCAGRKAGSREARREAEGRSEGTRWRPVSLHGCPARNVPRSAAAPQSQQRAAGTAGPQASRHRRATVPTLLWPPAGPPCDPATLMLHPINSQKAGLGLTPSVRGNGVPTA